MQYRNFLFFIIFFIFFVFGLLSSAYSALTGKSPLNSESTKALQDAQLLFDPQNRQVSIDALQSYLKKGEQHPYLYLKLAEWLYQANNFSTAEKAVKQALKLDNRFSEAWQLLAFCENSQGKSEKAAHTMQKLLAIEPSDHAKYLTAVFWLEAKKATMALPILTHLAQQKHVKSEWLIALAKTHQLLEQKEKTAAVIEQAAKEGKNSELYFQAGLLWLEAGKPQKALPLFEYLSKLSTPAPKWLVTLSRTYVDLKRPLEAAQIMEQVVKIAPNPENLYNCGLLWLMAEQPQKALKHLLQLVRMQDKQAKWFVALARTYLSLQKLPEAAKAMDKAAEISKKPDHFYQAGVIRLQMQEADEALARLLPLKDLPHPQAKWFAAISSAYEMKKQYVTAAQYMEKAAHIGKQNEHFYRAAALWLRAEKPEKSLPLLTYLTKQKNPEAKWFVLLSHSYCQLKNLAKAAESMEMAANISKQGKHYFAAAMLWRQVNSLDKTLRLLRLAVQTPDPKQRWLVELADLLLLRNNPSESLSVMKTTNLMQDITPVEVRYRGALIWNQLKKPKNSLPILQQICKIKDARYAWFAALVNISIQCGETDLADSTLALVLNRWPEKSEAWRLAVWAYRQRGFFDKAAAAMEIAIRLHSNGKEDSHKLAALYRMAGAPVEAGRIFAATVQNSKDPKVWDELAEIYLSGQRYQLALAPAEQAAKFAPTAERFENIGDIYFRLRNFQKSAEAYENSENLNVTSELLLKKGYAQLNLKQYKQAIITFQEVIKLSQGENEITGNALKNIRYIKQLYRSRLKKDS